MLFLLNYIMSIIYFLHNIPLEVHYSLIVLMCASY